MAARSRQAVLRLCGGGRQRGSDPGSPNRLEPGARDRPGAAHRDGLCVHHGFGVTGFLRPTFVAPRAGRQCGSGRRHTGGWPCRRRPRPADQVTLSTGDCRHHRRRADHRRLHVQRAGKARRRALSLAGRSRRAVRAHGVLRQRAVAGLPGGGGHLAHAPRQRAPQPVGDAGGDRRKFRSDGAVSCGHHVSRHSGFTARRGLRARKAVARNAVHGAQPGEQVQEQEPDRHGPAPRFRCDGAVALSADRRPHALGHRLDVCRPLRPAVRDHAFARQGFRESRATWRSRPRLCRPRNEFLRREVAGATYRRGRQATRRCCARCSGSRRR